MVEMLKELEPIAEIIGPTGVNAEYSGTMIYSRGTYVPGWKVTVNGMYKGAHIHFDKESPTLSGSASAALSQLKEALGLA